jgi:2,4-dichlorophenol 6-monooxygenase
MRNYEFAKTPLRRDAPLRSGNVPLLRLEPVLRRLAEEKNPGKILFGHRMVGFTDEGDFVVVKVANSKGIQAGGAILIRPDNIVA